MFCSLFNALARPQHFGGIPIIASEATAAIVDTVTDVYSDNDVIELPAGGNGTETTPLETMLLSTPGHTLDHSAFWCGGGVLAVC